MNHDAERGAKGLRAFAQSRLSVGLGVGAEECEHDTIDDLAILENAFPKGTFTNEPDLLKHTHRLRIPLEYRCLQPDEGQLCLGMGDHCFGSDGCDTSAPVVLPKPVAELPCLHLSALAGDDAYASSGEAANFDAKVCAGRRLVRERNPKVGIGFRVRMREPLKQIAPHSAVVRLLHQGWLVFVVPSAERDGWHFCGDEHRGVVASTPNE